MLSPGEYHLDVPRDLDGNLDYRDRLLADCELKPYLRAAALEMCRSDLLFYINVFVWQFNPRHNGREVGPFITYPFQADAALYILQCLREQEDVLIEKSRYQGASWLCLIIQDWCCQFHGWKKFLDISHTQDAVDRADDPDSLFWKLSFIHEHLPWWLSRGVKKRKLGFSYPATKSTVTGAATTERSGVGGRATGVLLDEFSKQRDDFAILGQTADTGPRVFSGTHYGTGSAFFGLTQRPDLRKIVMHWTAHPEMNRGLYRWDKDTRRVHYLRYDGQTREIVPDPMGADHDPAYPFVTDGLPSGGPFPGVRSPWYDKECSRRANRRDVSMHLDIDPQGSASQFFEPLVINRLIHTTARPPDWQGDLLYDRARGVPLELVSAPGGSLALWVRPDGQGRMPAARYAAGSDLSNGTGSTPSCLSVGNVRTGVKVAQLVNAHLPPEEFAVYAVALCRLFADAEGNGAQFAWEMQGPGLKFGQTVTGLYDRIYYRTDVFDRRKVRSDKPGWYPSPKGKRILLEDYRAGLVKGLVTNHSREALSDCLDFVYDGVGVSHSISDNMNDPSAGKDNHADRVIADALMYMMIVEAGGGSVVSEPAAAERATLPPNHPGTLEGRRLMAMQRNRLQGAWA